MLFVVKFMCWCYQQGRYCNGQIRWKIATNLTITNSLRFAMESMCRCYQRRKYYEGHFGLKSVVKIATAKSVANHYKNSNEFDSRKSVAICDGHIHCKSSFSTDLRCIWSLQKLIFLVVGYKDVKIKYSFLDVAAKLCQITFLLDGMKDIIHMKNINHQYPKTSFEETKLQVETKIHCIEEHDKENILLQNQLKVML